MAGMSTTTFTINPGFIKEIASINKHVTFKVLETALAELSSAKVSTKTVNGLQ